MRTCICGKPLTITDKGIVVPCSRCIDDTVQKVLIATIKMRLGQEEILKKRRSNMLVVMDSKKAELTKF